MHVNTAVSICILIDKVNCEWNKKSFPLAEGIHWNNLFLTVDLEYATTVSLGGVFILSILGSSLHFLLALYAYSLFPGKYGVPSVDFISQRYIKYIFYSITDERFHSNVFKTKFKHFYVRSNRDIPEERFLENDHNGEKTKFFEQIPENAFIPGIHIHDLKKSFSRGFLSGEESIIEKKDRY